MSLIRPGRTIRILRTLTTAITCMPGTRETQIDGAPLRTWQHDSYTEYVAGFPKGGNKHSGCSITVDNRIIPSRYVVSFAYPDDKSIQGRAIAIRIKLPHADLLIVCLYFPPLTSKGNAIGISKKLKSWIARLLAGAPRRTTPIVTCDGNARVGYDQNKHNVCPDNIGACDATVENDNGILLRELAQQFGLRIENTFRELGHTWWNATSKISARTEYFLSPISFSDNIISMDIDMYKGKILQFATTFRPIDHMPMITRIDFNTVKYDTTQQRLRWDTEACVDLVL